MFTVPASQLKPVTAAAQTFHTHTHIFDQHHLHNSMRYNSRARIFYPNQTEPNQAETNSKPSQVPFILIDRNIHPALLWHKIKENIIQPLHLLVSCISEIAINSLLYKQKHTTEAHKLLPSRLHPAKQLLSSYWLRR